MLNQEQAETALKKFASKEYVKRRKTLCEKLPTKLRDTSRGLCGCNTQGREITDWLKRREAVSQAAAQLDAMTVAQRKKIFTAMFPKMAEHVEAAWQQMKGQPYQESWVRKPFRAPASPELSLERRGTWLESLRDITAEYDQPITWFAEWAAHLAGYYGGGLGTLFAAAIDGGGKEGEQVYQTLMAGATGEHEIAQMGHHVIRAFLLCSREEAWEFMTKMLLAAQREEGLRQSILENVDMAHPGAFRRMLRVILDENLVRFAATVRAADVWLGLMWDSASTGVVKKMLEQVSEFLESKGARDTALRSDDAQAVYMALWTIAFEDTSNVLAPARKLLKHKNEEVRFAAAVLLNRLGQVESMKLLLPALADADLRVAAVAVNTLSDGQLMEADPKSGVFDRLEKLLDRFPAKKIKLKPLLWPWCEMTIHRQMIGGAMLSNLGDLPVDRMLPYIRDLDVNDRFRLVQLIGSRKRWNNDTRDALFSLVSDAGQSVRTAALEYIAKCKVTAEEAQGLEQLLTRKSGDLRRGVMSVLLGQKDPAAMASIERLLEDSNTMQRQAGIELMLLMVEADRQGEECRRMAQQFVDTGKKIPAAEKKLLDTVLDTGREVPTLDNALGLMDPNKRAEIPPVAKRKVAIISKAAAEVIYELDNLIHANREAPVECKSWDGSKEEVLLGNIGWRFPNPDGDVPIEKDIENLPRREIWEQWLAKRSAKSKDTDGLEFVRADNLLKMHELSNNGLNREGRKYFGVAKLKKLKYEEIIARVLPWLIKLSPATKAAETIFDMIETSYAAVPEKELAKVYDPNDWNADHWRDMGSIYLYCSLMASRHSVLCPGQWEPAHYVQLWKLERWRDEPFLVKGKKVKRFQVVRDRVDARLLLKAYEAKVATDADVYDAILGPRENDRYGSDFSILRQFTSRKPDELAKKHPWMTKFADRCRERVLEVELQRGDAPTEASQAAGNISCVWGIPNLIRIIIAIGKDTFTRNYVYGEMSRKDVFSKLLRVTMPTKTDTAKSLAAAVKKAGITNKRLLEVATFAPQWAGLVEGVLNWTGLEDAIWWIHAHTKDDRWSVDSDIRETWEAEISERTPLSGSDLVDGAVDVAWFLRVYDQLKKSKWDHLDAVAKYASGGGGHKRAQLFADAMLGRVKKTDLTKRIDEKRHQDTVRALGLLPLARGKSREKDILDRYKRMQEFIRTSRQFGSQRQTSERRAAAIGQANLARTAGYKDPIRLQWAMEARAVADLADGPISVKVKDTTVSLAIDELGGVDLTVQKNGKTLKTIPAAAKANKEVKALRERRKEIKRQVSRIRPTLEQMMCRGETVVGEELWELMRHPLISPMLGRLVLVGDGIMGYPEKGGKVLLDHAGKQEPVKKNESLRIAHPHDLLAAKKWHAWQRDCFSREIVQPFKQVFRELYPITKAEKKEKTQSRRYAGHQVNPRQALALLGNRQWVTVAEEGVRKTFHEENLSVHIEFQEGFYTPADIDGLTLEEVRFTERGTWDAVPLAKVPPRIFSEVMRDLDLVVSVAHRGGVDPEASASTIEARSDLLRETLALVDVDNVRIEKNHALIKGELGRYSVHMGSAVTHKMPGGAMILVPVHSQHRGRLFLPFADDDPKTAEVITKVLTLARDKEIRDPNILDQIRHLR